jgi:DNA repair protein SbcD/Mre11
VNTRLASGSSPKTRRDPPELKFLHAADVHLDSPLRGLERYEGAPAGEIRGATRRALEGLVDLAIVESVAFVLLAGDLYDGDWKDYNTGLYFVGQMARLREAGIRVFSIAGNHDAASQITKVLHPPANVHVFATQAPETVVLEDLGVAIHGQGFPTRAVSEDLTRAYPLAHPDLFNIGLLHTSLDGRAGHAVYAPCSVDGLRARGYQYWALGHVHKHEVVAREPWVVFPGNTQGRHARETGPKGCCLVEVEDGQVRRVEQRPLDVVRWAACPVDLADAASLGEAYDRVGLALSAAAGQAEGRLAATRIRLYGPCGIDARLRAQREQVVNECRALATTLGAGDLWVEKVLIDTHRAQSEVDALARDDAFGALLRSIRDLELDPGRLATLGDELTDLSVKLPAELRTGEEPFDPRSPEALKDCLEDVRALLLERLLGRDAGREGTE